MTSAMCSHAEGSTSCRRSVIMGSISRDSIWRRGSSIMWAIPASPAPGTLRPNGARRACPPGLSVALASPHDHDLAMPGPILQKFPLGSPWQTFDPFLFCVYHDDASPAGNDRMGPASSLAGRELGQDFAGKDG